MGNLSVSGVVEAGTISANNINGSFSSAALNNITSLGNLNTITVSGTANINSINASYIAGLLTTPSQTNITAVGTLGNLSVSGIVEAGTISSTTLQISSLSGLNNLSVTGTIDAGILSGVLSPGAQASITNIGQLNSLTITGNITANSISSMLTSPYQPNITTIGTLTVLTVNGVVSASILSSVGAKITGLQTDNGTGNIITTDGNGNLSKIKSISQIRNDFQILSDGTTINWDLSLGNTASITLGGSGRTLVLNNPIAGQVYTIKVTQDATGSRTISTWPNNTKWPSGIVPALSTTAAAVDLVTFLYDGTNFYALMNNDFH